MERLHHSQTGSDNSSQTKTQPQITVEQWGEAEQRPIKRYTLQNSRGMKLQLTDVGASITSIWVEDREGNFEDVVLGLNSAAEYIENPHYIGATVGRVANRIRHGQFNIDGKTYQLTQNDGTNHLHGAGEFRSAIWQSEPVESELGQGVCFKHFSKDGSHGYPGNVAAKVTYILTEENAIQIQFEATTDQATHVNLTNHSYFNLNGGKELIYDQQLWVNAKSYLPLDSSVNATGEVKSLAGSAWDLSTPTRMGDKMAQIPNNGYHHTYVLDKPLGEYQKVAELTDPASGRKMEVSTTQPAIVLYASNVLEKMIGKNGVEYGPHSGICIETQHHPDAANHPHFPSTLLKPDEKYQETVVYQFGLVNA